MTLGMPGWHPDPGGDGQRYFDGAAWGEHRPIPKDGYNTAERSEILEQVLVSQHAKVVTRTPATAAVLIGQPVNHILHLLLSVFTLGLWIPFWIITASTSGQKQYLLAVDTKGHVHWTAPGSVVVKPPPGFNQPVASRGATAAPEPLKRPNPFRD
ncbi:MAG: DUF2510 domain-containing protein [Actinomycetia bacterium]|nr:DUF2510 domain-containing protein [Actinomycetes bacterium]